MPHENQVFSVCVHLVFTQLCAGYMIKQIHIFIFILYYQLSMMQTQEKITSFHPLNVKLIV